MIGRTESGKVRRDAIELAIQGGQSKLPVRPCRHAGTRTMQKKNRIGFVLATDIGVCFVCTGLDFGVLRARRELE